MSLPEIDCEKDATPEEIKMLIAHGWEISEDQREARLYSEEWSPIQVAIWSTKAWIEDNLPEQTNPNCSFCAGSGELCTACGKSSEGCNCERSAPHFCGGCQGTGKE